MTSYGMVNTYQPQDEHIVTRAELKECSMDHQQFVYKVDICIRNSIKFSCITQYKSVSFA